MKHVVLNKTSNKREILFVLKKKYTQTKETTFSPLKHNKCKSNQ